MTTHLVLDASNPALSLLAVRTYDKKYTAVPNGKLPVDFLHTLNEFYFRLTGNKLDPEASSLSVKAEQGRFQRVYGPSCYASKEKDAFVIQWGRESIKVTPQKGGTFEGIDPENLSISFASVAYGQQLEAVLRLMFFDEADEDYIMDISLWPINKETTLVADSLNALLTRNPSKIFAQFAPQPEMSSFAGPQYSAGDLEEGSYSCIGYRQVSTNWGTKYLLLCAEHAELNQPVPFEIWSDKTTTPVLSLAPVITPEAPAELAIWGKRQTKKGTIAANQSLQLAAGALPQVEGGLDLSF